MGGTQRKEILAFQGNTDSAIESAFPWDFFYRSLTHSFIHAIVCPISDEEKEYAGISSLSESGQCKRTEKLC